MNTSDTSKMMIDALYNSEKEQYEIWSTDEASGIKSLLMIPTRDEIIQALKLMMINVFSIMAKASSETVTEKKE